MVNENKTRGFVTIATGREEYYRMAVNLLHSYRLLGGTEPFALICDKDRPECREFDDVVVMESASRSYLDKLRLYHYIPYDEAVFVDSDSLFISDPAPIWTDFACMDDFSGYGRMIPLDATDGWFIPSEMGEFSDDIIFGVRMHGGLYYLRKTDCCREVFERAIYLAENYSKYRFGHYVKPADEPVLALSMSVTGCKPCTTEHEKVLFLPCLEGRIKVTREGKVLVDKTETNAPILHYGSKNTARFVYRYLVAVIDHKSAAADIDIGFGEYLRIKFRTIVSDIKLPLERRIRRLIKYSLSVDSVRAVKTFLNRKS